MNAERLLNVAKALRESSAPEMFDMGSEVHAECGTPACAWGHYAARTDLQSLWKVGKIVGRCYFEVMRSGSCEPAWYCLPDVREHFDISWEEHEELFDPGGCDGALTPLAAAEYIERFVAKRLAEDAL